MLRPIELLTVEDGSLRLLINPQEIVSIRMPRVTDMMQPQETFILTTAHIEYRVRDTVEEILRKIGKETG